MNKKLLAVTLFLLFSVSSVYATPFLGYNYEHIKWTRYIPLTTKSQATEEGYSGQIDKGIVDLDGDGKEETIRVIWGTGVSDHALTIELYKDREMHQFISRLKPSGIQPNFKLEDLDNDGKLEVILWGAVDDPNMSQDSTDTSKPFEGHSAPHLFKVDTYKLDKEGYRLQKSYVSKEHYLPFCEEQPKE